MQLQRTSAKNHLLAFQHCVERDGDQREDHDEGRDQRRHVDTTLIRFKWKIHSGQCLLPVLWQPLSPQ